jgi:Protein of unknown function (DUF4232)
MTPDELDAAIRDELQVEARRAPAGAPVKAQVLEATRILPMDEEQPRGLRAWLVPMLAAAAVLLVTLGVTAGPKLLRSDGPDRTPPAVSSTSAAPTPTASATAPSTIPSRPSVATTKPTATAPATRSSSAPGSTVPQHWWYQHIDDAALPHTPGLCPAGLTAGPLVPSVPLPQQHQPELPVAQAISVPGEPEPLWLLPVTCNGMTDGSHPIPIEVFRYRPNGPQLVQTLAYEPGDRRRILVTSIAVTAGGDLTLTEKGYAPTDALCCRSLRFTQDYTWQQDEARYVAGAQVDTLQACTGNQLTVTSEPLKGQNGYADSRGIMLTYINNGKEPCTLTGYPGAAIVDAAGSTVADAVRTPFGILGGYTSGGSAPRVVLYTSGGTAVIEWTMTSHGGSRCYTNVMLLSTPPGTTATESYRRHPRVCGLQVHPVVFR